MLLNINVIIWDEAPMAPKLGPEAVDMLLRDLTHTFEILGGKTVVLGSEFRQVPRAVPRG